VTLVATPEARSSSDGPYEAGTGRLTRSTDVTDVLRRGRSRSGELLAVHVLRRPGPRPVGQHVAAERGDGPHQDGRPTARLTVIASRRVGGAVRRNRAKRLLREAARVQRWRDGLDVVLVARSGCARSDVHRVGAELARLAGQLDAVDA